MSHKLDIFDTLRAIDKRDFEFLDRQEDDVRKAFTPLVVMRWASAVRGNMDDLNLFLVNETANINFFDIADYPDLQYRLLASAGLGSPQKHEWIPMPKQRKGMTKLNDFLFEHWPDANLDELNILLKKFTRESFREFVNGCALDEKTTQGLIDAYDRHLGIEPEAKKAKPKGKGRGGN